MLCKYVSDWRFLLQLARNKRLDSFFVRNLNLEPDGWALADRSFDAVLCCVSVQYLQQVRALYCFRLQLSQCAASRPCLRVAAFHQCPNAEQRKHYGIFNAVL